MQVIAKRTLREFWLRHPAAETPLKLWYARAVRARWVRPNDLRAQFGATVDFVAGNRAIFDIGGNKYRLVVKIDYTGRKDPAGNPIPEVISLGSGKAYLLRDGKMLVGTWTRESEGQLTSFKTKAGKEFILKPGTTWVELYPTYAPKVKA